MQLPTDPHSRPPIVRSLLLGLIVLAVGLPGCEDNPTGEGEWDLRTEVVSDVRALDDGRMRVNVEVIRTDEAREVRVNGQVLPRVFTGDRKSVFRDTLAPVDDLVLDVDLLTRGFSDTLDLPSPPPLTDLRWDGVALVEDDTVTVSRDAAMTLTWERHPSWTDAQAACDSLQLGFRLRRVVLLDGETRLDDRMIYPDGSRDWSVREEVSALSAGATLTIRVAAYYGMGYDSQMFGDPPTSYFNGTIRCLRYESYTEYFVTIQDPTS